MPLSSPPPSRPCSAATTGTHGGWGGAPKFPQTPVLLFLLDRHRRAGDRMALDMARHALSAMAAGGIADQVGGGFHRYSVDARWTVPHFEKMLYDNALLARAYLHACAGDRVNRHFGMWQRPRSDFLYRELRDPRGAFYSSLDADTEGGEGVFYTWTPAEVASRPGGSRTGAACPSGFRRDGAGEPRRAKRPADGRPGRSVRGGRA